MENLLLEIYSFFLPGFQAIEIYFLKKLAGAFIPAFFMAGAMAVFIPKSFIIRYLSAGVKPYISYPIALVGGGVLSVCACGILPLFQTIFQRGAGVGPALTFLFAGPAINVIAILFTYQLLGKSLGNARVLGVAFLSLVIGMGFSYFFETQKRKAPPAQMNLVGAASVTSSFWPKFWLFACLMGMVLTLPQDEISWQIKGPINLALIGFILFISKVHIASAQRHDWLDKSFFLLKQIVPKLLAGVFLVGMLEPYLREFLVSYLDSNSFLACFLSATVGGLMYVGTILGVVAVKGLVSLGMPDGPALALLLAGPSIALPSMFVIISVTGRKIGLSFCVCVILLSALCGYIFPML